MAETKWTRRDEKQRKKKHGMRVTGRSIFTLQAVQKKKADQAKSKPKTKARAKKKTAK
ncbi:MAG: hypothetical protein KJZ53_08855 [Anaerolineales bacterium]|nr:hypothetical protein [Anaerolineales bacterium]MCL4258622.1 hypothetical protein [Anaerolineales bacterium]